LNKFYVVVSGLRRELLLLLLIDLNRLVFAIYERITRHPKS